MNTAIRKVLVVGGNGFVGSAVCKAALARGIQVTSVSSSGNPYRTTKGHVPGWTAKVDWQRGDAFHPETFAHLFSDVDGVVHTLGTLLEDSNYKHAIRDGDVPTLLSALYQTFSGDSGNPLQKKDDTSRKSYNALNRDAALRVCEAFISSSPETIPSINTPRPFIFISAEDVFRPLIPARYIESKREAEQGIEQIIGGNIEYRGVYIRPSLVYHAHSRPLTTPAAVLLDFSSALHKRAPQGFPTPSSILRSLASSLEHSSSSSALESIANALTIPPIHVDHVAAAICVALDSRNDVRDAVGVRRMRELIGWSDGEVTSGAGLAKT